MAPRRWSRLTGPPALVAYLLGGIAAAADADEPAHGWVSSTGD